MELAICIKNLLYNHDIVIIPGFGGLVTKYKPAEINLSDNTIAPPAKYLTFDSKLSVSDGLLLGYLATSKGIGLKEADNIITNEIGEIKNQLDSQGNFQLEDIGLFIKKNDDILFSQTNTISYLTDSYGLSGVSYKHKESAPVIKFEFKEEKTTLHHKKSRKGLWITASIVLLLAGGGAGVYYYCPNVINKILQKKQPTVTTPQPEKTEKAAKATPKDTAKTGNVEDFFDNATDKKKALAISSDTTSKSKPKTKAQPQNKPAAQAKVQTPPAAHAKTPPAKIQSLPVEPKVKQSENNGVSYYIIAGSFKTAKKAGILVKELEAQGFQAEVVQFGEDTFRVSLGQFKNKAKANAETEKIKAKGKEVWLVSK